MKTFEGLIRGDIVRNIGSGNSYLVAANNGDTVTVIRTVTMTNPSEWELIAAHVKGVEND